MITDVESVTEEMAHELRDIDRKLRSPWLYTNTGNVLPGSACIRVMGRNSVGSVLDAIRAEMFAPDNPRKFSPDEREAIEALRPSDLRDSFADRVYRATGGNIFAVKAALGHRSATTTIAYLRQRKQINACFKAFAAVTGVALSEVGAGHAIDPAVLRARCYTGVDVGISDAMRSSLAASRTRMGMGCAAPFDPPPELAPGHQAGSLCAVQRCVLCRHGFFFKDEPGAMEAMATRHGELCAIRDSMPVNRFFESSFRVELVSVESVLRDFYPDRTDDFLAISAAVNRDVREGRRPDMAQIAMSEGAQ